MKASDRRITPLPVLEAAAHFAGGRLVIDVCTEPDNPMGAWAWVCPGRFGLRTMIGRHTWPSGCGLRLDWTDVLNVTLADMRKELEPQWMPRRAVGWMNPPFSEPTPWITRWARARGTWLAFTAVDYTARWWKTVDGASLARCELAQRPKCYDPATGKRFDVARSAAVWLKSDAEGAEADFRMAFSSLGRVVTLG